MTAQLSPSLPPREPRGAHDLLRRPGAPLWSGWLGYALAVVAVVATLMLRLAVRTPMSEPLLELFLLPILLSTYLGGLGPGLLATALAATLTNLFLLAPFGKLTIGASIELTEWWLLALNGALLSALIEGLHRARRRAETSRRLQAVTLASIGDAVITTDAQGSVTFLNPEAERLTGWPSCEAAGRPLAAVFRVIDAQTREPALDPAAEVLRTGGISWLSGNALLLARDGHEIPIDDSSAPIRLGGAPITGVVLVFRDASAQKRAEQALQSSERTLKLFVEHAPAAIAMFDTGMRYIAASNRYRQDYRLGDQPLVGRSHYEVFPEIPERWRAIHRRCLAGAVERCEDDPFPRADGSLDWVRWELHPWYERPGELGGLVLFSEVITERKRVEAALAEERSLLAERVEARTADLRVANAELARASRLKDEFMANVSHELRTPLNAILGRAGLLAEQLYGPLIPSQIEALGEIEASGQRLLELVNDILDLSKLTAGKLESEHGPVDVAQLCESCLQVVAPSALQRQVALSSRLDPQVRTIIGDERRLRQLLVNLLSNAVKFTPDGGQVGVEFVGEAEDERATFTVWDTGIGIAAEDMGRLFKPFSQVDSGLSRRYDGSGLGLALVLRLTQAHGGSVSVESEPGRGSRFSVALPWPAPRPEAAAQPEAGPRQSLILAEGLEAGGALTVERLGAHGYAVSVVYEGAQALALALAAPPAAVLVDTLMPDSDGIEVIRRIRGADGLGALPIVALTSLAISGERERCLAAGASAYMTRPVSPRALLELLAPSPAAPAGPAVGR